MILTAGNINHDIQIVTDRLPRSHEKMVCSDTLSGPGGSAANTAHWLSVMGASVRMAGCVGSDTAGREQVKLLSDQGVDVSSVLTVEAATGLAVVLSMHNEKRMIKVPGANAAAVTADDLGAFLEDVTIVYLSGDNESLMGSICQRAEKAGIRVVLGGTTTASEKLLAMANGAILNHDEAREITGLDKPVDAIAALDLEMAAITLEGGGCLVTKGIESQLVPLPSVIPVDRTGGGDAFAAGFLAALERGMPVTAAGQWGNILASEVIMARGARPAIAIPSALDPPAG
jgi:ribokinase